MNKKPSSWLLILFRCFYHARVLQTSTTKVKILFLLEFVYLFQNICEPELVLLNPNNAIAKALWKYIKGFVKLKLLNIIYSQKAFISLEKRQFTSFTYYHLDCKYIFFVNHVESFTSRDAYTYESWMGF